MPRSTSAAAALVAAVLSLPSHDPDADLDLPIRDLTEAARVAASSAALLHRGLAGTSDAVALVRDAIRLADFLGALARGWEEFTPPAGVGAGIGAGMGAGVGGDDGESEETSDCAGEGYVSARFTPAELSALRRNHRRLSTVLQGQPVTRTRKRSEDLNTGLIALARVDESDPFPYRRR